MTAAAVRATPGGLPRNLGDLAFVCAVELAFASIAIWLVMLGVAHLSERPVFRSDAEFPALLVAFVAARIGGAVAEAGVLASALARSRDEPLSRVSGAMANLSRSVPLAFARELPVVCCIGALLLSLGVVDVSMLVAPAALLALALFWRARTTSACVLAVARSQGASAALRESLSPSLARHDADARSNNLPARLAVAVFSFVVGWTLPLVLACGCSPSSNLAIFLFGQTVAHIARVILDAHLGMHTWHGLAQEHARLTVAPTESTG